MTAPPSGDVPTQQHAARVRSLGTSWTVKERDTEPPPSGMNQCVLVTSEVFHQFYESAKLITIVIKKKATLAARMW